MTWQKIADYLRDNISRNIKKLMATVGSMITTFLATIVYVTKEGYGWRDAIIILLLALQPFFYVYINIIFRGESELNQQQLLLLQRELDFMREIAEYRVLLAAKEGKVPAAILSNYDWNDINKRLEELEAELQKNKSSYIPATSTNINYTDTYGGEE